MTEPQAGPHTTSAQRRAAGKALRTARPRAGLAELTMDRRDPLGILAEQNAGRVPDLVPLRAERMAVSAFTFYRGTAAIMAADLAGGAHTGILVAACGDAHIANFGLYASPQRTLVFDLNDFDEAGWAPWEWDLKRLVTSVVIAGQATGRAESAVRGAASDAVRRYASALGSAVDRSPLVRYYEHFDVRTAAKRLEPSSRAALRDAVRDARQRTGNRAARKLVETDAQGRARFVERPPAMTRLGPEMEQRQGEFFEEYTASAPTDIRLLLGHYQVTDLVRRVVGVGSVGTRCTLALLRDGDGNSLVLQGKQAGQSVLEQYGGIRQPEVLTTGVAQHGEGWRVVGLQRVLQAVSDPFLGHLRNDIGDFYVRQFHDMKGGLDAESLDDIAFHRYALACATALARAHSQSPAAAVIAGYIGGGRTVAAAILAWAEAYAEVSRADWKRFVAALA